jgi:hypothetical protein
MLTYILIVLCIVVGFLYITRTQKQTDRKEILLPQPIKHNERIQKKIPTINDTYPDDRFVEAKFHIGYVDVINAFNNLAPSQRQIFNINNVPCNVSDAYDKAEVTEMMTSFIESLNNDIKNNVMSVHSVNSGWDEQVFEPTIKSGWDKVQESLGLPTTLYQRPAVKTQVHLVSFGNVLTYETENEIKYVAKVILAKEKVAEKLVIQVAFVMVKGVAGKETNVIIENIDVLGFMTSQGQGIDHIELDNFYNFDSLEKNNMVSGTTVAQELMNKYNMRKKIMQERIDNSDTDVQEKYATSPSPADYDTYKMTTNIIDDMFVEPKYD